MFDIHTVELDWGGRKLTLETGKVARQADGAVVATYGESKVLATVVAAKQPREGIDFMPLTVDYQEKYYAAGRIPGGYFKREGRPTEKETLVSRLIDRPIRPLFADGWRCETQVIVTTMSHDLENDPDILALVASSAALTLSGAPFMGPIGAARVGFVNGEYVLNPTIDEMAESQLDLVVAGAAVKKAVMAHFFPEGAEPKYDKLRVAAVFKELEGKIVRWNVLDTKKRIDGRDLTTVRPIVCEVGVLPRTHGSALFTRGETQG